MSKILSILVILVTTACAGAPLVVQTTPQPFTQEAVAAVDASVPIEVVEEAPEELQQALEAPRETMTPSRFGYPIPEAEVNRETQLWITKLFLLESGWDKRWKNRREHSLVAWIGVARYRIRLKLDKDETYVRTIRSYSRGLRPDRRTWTPKMMWVLALEAPESHIEGNKEIVDSVKKPEFFPSHLKWERYERFLIRTWVHAGRWMHGYSGNPCTGALHWGGDMDPVPRGMKRLACSKKFDNTVYGRKR